MASCCSESAGTSPNLSSSSSGETVGEQCINPRILAAGPAPMPMTCTCSCGWLPLTYFHLLFCQLQGSLRWHIVSLLLLQKRGKVGREGGAWCVIPHWEEVSHIHTVKHPLRLYIVPTADAVREEKSFNNQILYRGKILREKTLAIFSVYGYLQKVFSTKFGSVASFGAAKRLIRKSLLPQKFPCYTVPFHKLWWNGNRLEWEPDLPTSNGSVSSTGEFEEGHIPRQKAVCLYWSINHLVSDQLICLRIQ